VGALTVVAKFLASDIVVAALAVITVFCIGMDVVTRSSRPSKVGQVGNEASFDMPIRDVIGHLEQTVPHSFDQSSSAERLAFKQLHERMCSGDLPVIGSTTAFGSPQLIPAAKCRELTPQDQAVPANPSAPQGVRFCLIQYLDPNWADDWDGLTQPKIVVQYTDLRVRSVDLYRLWPRTGAFS